MDNSSGWPYLETCFDRSNANELIGHEVVMNRTKDGMASVVLFCKYYNKEYRSRRYFFILSTDIDPLRRLDVLHNIKTIGCTQIRNLSGEHAAMSSVIQNKAGEFVSQKDACPGSYSNVF